MARFRVGNPALSDRAFQDAEQSGSRAMTVQGTIFRTAFLMLLLVTAGLWTWNLVSNNPKNLDPVLPWLIGGVVGGLVLALITIFAKKASPITAPLYAVCEGLFLGAISALFEAQYQGIVIQAVGLTCGVLFTMLAAYSFGFIRVTHKFVVGVVAATGAICLVYLASFILGIFGIPMPYIHGSGPIGIIFSLVVVVIASLNLVLDFAFIDEASRRGAPKYMEWYAAFGLLVTLVWLYLEILRLLSKLRRR